MLNIDVGLFILSDFKKVILEVSHMLLLIFIVVIFFRLQMTQRCLIHDLQLCPLVLNLCFPHILTAKITDKEISFYIDERVLTQNFQSEKEQYSHSWSNYSLINQKDD